MRFAANNFGLNSLPLAAARYWFSICFLCLICLFPLTVSSQIISSEKIFGDYRQFIWQDQHGLPQNGIRQIVQTPDGYLWLAIAEGVVRFDGVNFTAQRVELESSATGQIQI